MTEEEHSVLIAEDDPASRSATRLFLQRVGYHVGEAADGPATLREASMRHYDIVILDLGMPGLEGEEVEFLGGELDLLLVHLDAVGGAVDDQPVVLDASGTAGGLTAPQHGPDPGVQLRQGAGLHHIVVRTQIQDPDALCLL